MDGKTPADANSVGVLFLKDSFATGLIFKTVGFGDGLSLLMIKTASAAIACVALAAPAMAGPYANVENNAGWAGSQFAGSSTDLHLGWEGSNGVASYYLQGGPTLLSPNGGEAEVELGGKLGGSLAATEDGKLSFYGEFAFLTGDAANGYGTKVGAKYKF